MKRYTSLPTPDGSIVATVPNHWRLRTVWNRIKGDPAVKDLGNYQRSGVQIASKHSVRG